MLKLFYQQETGSGNISQKSDEDDFVKVEDLPLKLAVYSEVCCLKIKVFRNIQVGSVFKIATPCVD